MVHPPGASRISLSTSIMKYSQNDRRTSDRIFDLSGMRASFKHHASCALQS